MAKRIEIEGGLYHRTQPRKEEGLVNRTFLISPSRFVRALPANERKGYAFLPVYLKRLDRRLPLLTIVTLLSF